MFFLVDKKIVTRCTLSVSTQNTCAQTTGGQVTMAAFGKHALVSALVGAAALSWAGMWAPGIAIDGNFDDWDGILPAMVTDPSGDGGSGRDVKAVYLANDSQALYIRIESYNSNVFDGNEFIGIDGDNNTATGFNLFGAGIGSDLLVAGASMYGETTANFNNGPATPSSVSAWGPSGATTNVELAIPLSTTMPGNITQAFPGGLGSTIKVLYGDGNSGAWDIAVGLYTLATPTPSPATITIDDCSLYDDHANAAFRTRDVSNVGCSAGRSRFSAGGPGGPTDHALATTHSLSTTAWAASVVAKRFGIPKNILGHQKITLDVYGDPAATNKNLWVGLIDADGTYFAVTVAFPTSTGWTTVDLGPTSTWLEQSAGSEAGLDRSNIVEWRIGMQNQGANTGGSFAVAYDNLRAIGSFQNVTYTESASDVPNPERGVFRWGGDITDLNIDYQSFASGGARLVYNDIRLDNYTSSTIPQAVLDNITSGFALIRQAGLKSIVRIKYNDTDPSQNPSVPPKEASPTYLVQHLAQLQPVLEANKDVIAYFYAGIIGAWGEWHSTYYYREPNTSYAVYNLPSAYWRRWVIDQLLTYLPSDRFILIRRPWFKDPAFGSDALWPGERVTEETAFTTAGVARVGHHNDAFLASEDDWGTYASGNVEAQKDFLSTDTLYVPIGGETANPGSYATCSNAIAEMQRLHWTFLHQDYHPTVIQNFQTNGCWPEITKRLGYRLVLTSATLPQKIVSGQPFTAFVTIENRGWAPPYYYRPVYLVVTDGGNTALDTIPVPVVDIRRIKPGESHTWGITATATLPPTPPSTVSLALWLPDPSPSLQSNPAYSLRFANDGTWNSTKGWNELGSVPTPVQISRIEFD
ncbi:MAG: DUF4832 domain-containing protein [Candidatus Hydrogenedentota bacterium]|nr:MAG: DUF4832 domain-containing protein [Candidatus Hydrogenedentota bacterium]